MNPRPARVPGRRPTLPLAAAAPVLLLASLVAGACSPEGQASGQEGADGASEPAEGEEPIFASRRASMVDRHLRARDIDDERVLDAMDRVPRQEFVPDDLRDMAYRDRPLPIGAGQTISQPYIVALMTQLAEPGPDETALDVGTGSGYQAAVLAELVDHVYSVEIVEELAETARARLDRLGYENVTVRHGDGYRGWPEHAPFDVIILAAAPTEVPPALVEQLAPGGRLVLPVDDGGLQRLLVIAKDPEGRVTRRVVADVMFVPMTGEAQEPGAPGR